MAAVARSTLLFEIKRQEICSTLAATVCIVCISGCHFFFFHPVPHIWRCECATNANLCLDFGVISFRLRYSSFTSIRFECAEVVSIHTNTHALPPNALNACAKGSCRTIVLPRILEHWLCEYYAPKFRSGCVICVCGMYGLVCGVCCVVVTFE